ncbi:uncharacterized protein LOC114872381 [Osmia bicornis bicornis]|uniref:uncharacterized protein LOC114872381 n=1 Tax=Osmia bicornis bicornis TaxID=1437191 RepID=UPI001EAF7EC1|nr:uncharacterized protein LOC114872381 [Osmia bicornis bicornis]
MLLYAMFDPNNNAGRALTVVENETFPQLKRPEDVIKQPCWERMDVNAEVARTVQHAGQKKGKRKRKSGGNKEKRRREREEKAAKRNAEEKERLRKWEECWEKEFEAEEERNKAECCKSDGLCLKPRTQSNIWINVVRDRSIQEIHMAFK